MSSHHGSPAHSAQAAHAGAILDAALDAVVTIDHLGSVLEFNRAAERTFGYTRAAVLGQELAALIVPPELRERHRAALARWSAHGPLEGAGAMLGRRVEVEAMRSNGERFAAELAISRVELSGPPVFTACIRDVSAHVERERRLREAEARYRNLVEQLPLAVYIDAVDAVSSNVYTSPQIEAMLGYTPAEWQEDPDLFVRLLHPSDRDRVLAAHAHTHATGEPLSLEYRLVSRDGNVVWVHDEARLIPGDEAGTPLLQGYLLDVTQRRWTEQLLHHQALHDPLTGLANRSLFGDRVQHALDRLADGTEVAVLVLDLDDFQTVNDGLGHEAGDALLRSVAARLRGAVPQGATIARVGGDEFATLIEDVGDASEVIATAASLVAALRSPFRLSVGGVFRDVVCTASIGVAVGLDADDLLRTADVAAVRAKAAGKAQYAVYTAAMGAEAVGRSGLIADLRRASVERDFEVHFQPTVDLETGRIVGAEALARWRRPDRDPVPPSVFIPAAEELNVIVPLGRWVLRAACREAAQWPAPPGVDAIRLSVNVSARQLEQPSFVDDVRAALRETGLEPGALTLEVTESVIARQHESLTETLESVRALGLRVALDDFGTGYSSLSQLLTLPVDELKIDRSFVRRIESDPDRAALVRAVVELGHALGLTTVAEGVESAPEVRELQRLGCDVAQGFHFARPLPAEAFRRHLAQHATVEQPAA
ncbi:MAG TPA: EAL domain-containing protein [Gaiellaceae bacterium]|nr:EAL domain-containing protein [Gaiellaceae bacterium]